MQIDVMFGRIGKQQQQKQYKNLTKILQISTENIDLKDELSFIDLNFID